MADNLTLNSGSGGATLAADEISGVHHQRVKIQHGADGSATDVSTASPLPVSDAGGSLTVDNSTLSVVGGGTESTALRVTLASDSTGVVSVDDNGASLTVDNAVLSVTGGGVEASALRVTIATDSTGVLSVDDNGGSLTVDVGTALPAGTNAIGKLASNTGVTIGAVEIASAQTLATVTTCSTVSTLTGGGVAHDSADSGNPHKIGAKAETSLSGVTLVADGDRTDLHAGVDGVLIVRPHCNLEDAVQDRTTNTDGASTAFTGGLAAPGSGIRIWLTSVTISNSSSSFCTVDIRDGTAGSVLWTFPCPATGGVTHTFNPPLKFTANTAVAFDASAATSTLSISANGFKSKV